MTTYNIAIDDDVNGLEILVVDALNEQDALKSVPNDVTVLSIEIKGETKQ